MYRSEIPALKNSSCTPRDLRGTDAPANVLVVDDNAAMLESITAVVAQMGLRITAVSSGRAALRELLQKDFALVLLDVNMPGLNGFETASLIRGRPRSAHLPIIFVTAAAFGEDERFHAYQLGAVDVIYSPVLPEILRAKVQVFADAFYLNRQLVKQAEELQRRSSEITAKNIELEEASRAKSAFFTNMSHELRTPLNAIIGFSEVLKDGLVAELSPRQQEYVVNIFESGLHLLSLINDVLDLSKIDAGKLQLEPTLIELNSLLTDSLAVVREKAATHNMRLSLDMDSSIGSLFGDARRIKQILYNLLSNAVKFTPSGGEVRVSAKLVDRERASTIIPGEGNGHRQALPSSETGTFVEISVRDTGIGIAPTDLPLLFQPFVQVDGSLSRQFEGTGLGLAMVRRLAELHGGTVAVASTPAIGSTFTVWLPHQMADTLLLENSPHTDKEEPKSSALALRALVIEDDLSVASTMRSHLEADGFRVDCAHSAEDGQALAQRLPAIIVLDILLPGMNGWDCLARLKQTPALSHVPVVIVSCVADKGKGQALGAAAVLQKPIGRDELLATIRELGISPGIETGLQVLVVDDDPKTVEWISNILIDAGCSILRAYGGKEAIAVAQRVQPDLIVLDLMMPEFNGFDVVSELRNRAATAQIPILVLTARNLSKSEGQVLEGRVRGVLGKTHLGREAFLNEVRRALAVPQRSAQLEMTGCSA